MKDVMRDELERKLFGVLNDDGIIPTKALAAINEALTYVQNNPTIYLIELEQEALEDEVVRVGEEIEELYEDYEIIRNRLDAYRDAVLIMEKHA